jgi:hypothetical protein
MYRSPGCELKDEDVLPENIQRSKRRGGFMLDVELLTGLPLPKPLCVTSGIENGSVMRYKIEDSVSIKEEAQD